MTSKFLTNTSTARRAIKACELVFMVGTMLDPVTQIVLVNTDRILVAFEHSRTSVVLTIKFVLSSFTVFDF